MAEPMKSVKINVFKKHFFDNTFLTIGVLLTILVVVGGGGYFGYRRYVISREESAQKIFSDCYREFERAHAGQAPWSTVVELFKLGYDKCSNSTLAPYFLAYQAEALASENKKTEAFEVLTKAVNSLSTSSPLYYLYATKRALLELDINPDHYETLQSLTTTENPNRDMALYYMGLYFWSKDEVEKARSSWTTLVEMKQPEQSMNSPWISLAETKLNQIV